MSGSAPRTLLPDGTLKVWSPSTLRTLGKDEAFLEELIGSAPELLGLEPYRTGVRGPFFACHQRTLETPQGRIAKPDILILTQSGHIVVVEVKLIDNAELRDRRVVGQVIEYAAALASYNEVDLLELFGADDGSWELAVARMFPKAHDAPSLAKELLRKVQTASIHLVIACDTAPEGLRDFVRAVTNQHALGAYELHVVELVPHVTDDGVAGGILMTPSRPIRTEVVARTAITVSYQSGQVEPGIKVEVTSQDEVEAAIEATRSGESSQMRPELADAIRAWDESEPKLKTVGRSPRYRQIKPEGWPGPVHYEFLVSGRSWIAAELHLESDGVAWLGPLLQELSSSLKPSVPDIGWDATWGGGKGRLFLRYPLDDPKMAARGMRVLIDSTLARVSDAINEGGASRR